MFGLFLLHANVLVERVLEVYLFASEGISSHSAVHASLDSVVKHFHKFPLVVLTLEQDGGLIVTGTNISILTNEAAGQQGCTKVVELLAAGLRALKSILLSNIKEVHNRIVSCEGNLLATGTE